jgi:hypothetical protein
VDGRHLGKSASLSVLARRTTPVPRWGEGRLRLHPHWTLNPHETGAAEAATATPAVWHHRPPPRLELAMAHARDGGDHGHEHEEEAEAAVYLDGESETPRRVKACGSGHVLPSSSRSQRLPGESGVRK